LLANGAVSLVVSARIWVQMRASQSEQLTARQKESTCKYTKLLYVLY
jgi:hypothetical protein